MTSQLIRPDRRHLPLAALLPILAALAGCNTTGSHPSENRYAVRQPPGLATGDTRPLTDDQVFEVQLATARSLERQGDLERAEAAFRALRQIRPDNPTVAHRLAVICERQGRFDESDALFDVAAAGSAPDPVVLTDLGYSLYRRGRWAEAEQVLQRALALSPSSRRAYNHLGLVFAQTGRRDKALAAFRRAGCTEPEARMNVALVLTLNEQYAAARQEYAVAQSIDPHSTEATRRAAQLDRLLAEAQVTPAPAGHAAHSPDDLLLTSGTASTASSGTEQGTTSSRRDVADANRGTAGHATVTSGW